MESNSSKNPGEEIKSTLDQAESLLQCCLQSMKETCVTWNRLGNEIKAPNIFKFNVEEFLDVQKPDRKEAIPNLTLTAEEHSITQELNEIKKKMSYLMQLSGTIDRRQTKLARCIRNSVSPMHEFNALKRTAHEEVLKLRNTYADELKKFDAIIRMKDDELAKLKETLKNKI